MAAELTPTRTSMLRGLADGAECVRLGAWEKYRWWIRKACRDKGISDRDELDELVHSVWSEVIKRARTFRIEPERPRFRDWLGWLSSKRAIDFLRRRNREPVELPGWLDPQGSTDEIDLDLLTLEGQARLKRRLEEWEAVVAAVRSRARGKTWEAYRLREHEKLSYAEVAERLGIRFMSAYRAHERIGKRLWEEAQRRGLVE